MRRGRPLAEWYLAARRARRRGRWRFSVPVCVLILFLLSPEILVIEALTTLAVSQAATALALPPLAVLILMGAAMLIVALILAELLYFVLRESGLEDNGARCRVCNYDLTGHVSGVCPECGQTIVVEPLE